MTRGTFANVRIKNLMVPGTEGGVTKVRIVDDEGGEEYVSYYQQDGGGFNKGTLWLRKMDDFLGWSHDSEGFEVDTFVLIK